MKKFSTITAAFFFVMLSVVVSANGQSPGALTSIKTGKVINFSDLAKKELLNPPAITQLDNEEKDGEKEEL